MVATDDLLRMYTTMVTSVLWERQLYRLLDEGVTHVPYHSGRGQEAVGAGACAALRAEDYLFYSHRGVAALIGKGLSLEKLFGDFLGTTAGATGGLGAGIPHVAAPEIGILGFSGTLGGTFTLAAGAGLSAKYRGTDDVCLCLFGDGTANRGTFHEAANAAAVWKLPVIWLCENNEWGLSVHVSESTAVEHIADRAAAYDMPGTVVDGQDVVAVHDAVAEAVERAQQGGGPTLIEAKTVRFEGHYRGDPETYRTGEHVAHDEARDPVEVAASALRERGVTGEAIEAIWSRARGAVAEAAEAARAAPRPSRERIFEGLYA